MVNWAGAFQGLGEGMDDLSRAKEKTLDMEYRNMRDANLRRFQLDDRASANRQKIESEDRAELRTIAGEDRGVDAQKDKEGRAEERRERAEERAAQQKIVDDKAALDLQIEKEGRDEKTTISKEKRKEERDNALMDLKLPAGKLREAEKDRDARRNVLIAEARRARLGEKAAISEDSFVDRELSRENKFMEDLIRDRGQLDEFMKTQPARVDGFRETYRMIYGNSIDELGLYPEDKKNK